MTTDAVSDTTPTSRVPRWEGETPVEPILIPALLPQSTQPNRIGVRQESHPPNPCDPRKRFRLLFLPKRKSTIKNRKFSLIFHSFQSFHSFHLSKTPVISLFSLLNSQKALIFHSFHIK